jgi:DNA polymerase III epsilon subunit-like protein
MFKSPIVVIDTETTGFLGHDWARVIELGAVLIDTDGQEVGCFESLVRPDILDERAAGALAVNHIDPASLADAPTTAEVTALFREWCGDNWTTAYNVGFDRSFIERMGIYDLRWATCIMLRSKQVLGRQMKLSAVAEHFQVPVIGDAHRALTDARTAAGVMVAIKRMSS